MGYYLNPVHKSFRAGGAISPFRLVRHGTADDTVVQASAVGDALIGVNVNINVPGAQARVDIVISGVAEVEYGGTVTRGALLTTDASGRAVVAAPAAGTNNRIIGVALEAGVVGDIGTVNLSPGSFQG